MTAVSVSQCLGLWRRTLLIKPDGSTDLGTDVMWLQGVSAFVDSRGFAGRLRQDADIFEWCRVVDLDPGPFPDAGSMRWEGETLIETGVHEPYTERWVRERVTPAPVGAMFLTSPGGAQGVVVRVGSRFGWADEKRVVVDTLGGEQWQTLNIERADDGIAANGVRWSITDSEGVFAL